jgi:hypothetical protein
MDHMKRKWRAAYDPEEDEWCVETAETAPWHICAMQKHIDDDASGEKTAKEICKLHNNAIARG